jgi:HEPN domain-containing protein
MISRINLRKLATARLADSEILFENGRYDGAVYLSGYAIEVALKARICRTLKWPDFPSSAKEFEPYRSLRTHNLDVLLSLSGIENKIKTKHLTEWSIIATWDPEVRYKSTQAKRQDALSIIEAVKTLLKVL